MNLIPVEDIKQKIYTLRGEEVMFDTDLAALYRVETKTLNRAVRRNIARFPNDFMIEATEAEVTLLRYQIGTIDVEKSGIRGGFHSPFLFTQSGVAMLSTVLKSSRAIQINISIIRAFVELRKKAQIAFGTIHF